MKTKIKQVLGSLEDRAGYHAGATDRISLRDYIVAVEIGAFQIERDVSQRLKFNIVVDVPPMDSDLNDDVDKILSYDTLTDAIQTELAYERLNLLETLAERIAARVLKHPQAQRIYLRIEKLDRGAGDLGVEIMREGESDDVFADLPPPAHFVFLTKETIDSPHLSVWLDTLTTRSTPLVICVEAAPQTQKVAQINARNHIEVLAVDQAAWRVAAANETCLVVGSRTELNWAIANAKPCIWAPAKMVFDAVPVPENLSGFDLAVWLGSQVPVKSFALVGTAPKSAENITCYAMEKPEDYR